MLRVVGGVSRHCDAITRRSFVQAGVLGVGGMMLGDFLGMQSAQAAPRESKRDASVILFWLSGGPGHMETWDPKPEAQSEYRGPFGAIRTQLPGIQFCELLPEQAKRLGRLAVLRTINHDSGDHTKCNHWMLTGFEGPAFNAPDNTVQRRPAMGSAVARLAGLKRPGMPPYVAVPHLRGGTDNLFHYAAYLGGGSNPFIVESDPNLAQYKVRNLSLPKDISFERLEDRRHLLESLDGLRRANDAKLANMSQYYQRAFDLLLGKEAMAAFDIAAESPKVREVYGRHTFGQSALLARRLVEAGVTFVTVNCVPWDHHGTPPQLKTEAGVDCSFPRLTGPLEPLSTT